MRLGSEMLGDLEAMLPVVVDRVYATAALNSAGVGRPLSNRLAAWIADRGTVPQGALPF